MTRTVTEPGREAWLDFVKAAAIFLIVLGHSRGLPETLRGVIYCFHVPTFLMVTGYLLPRNFAARPGDFPKAQLAAFLRLYLFFSALSVLLLALGLWFSDAPLLSPLTQAVKGVLYGVSGKEKNFVHQNSPLWYFPFLVSSLFIAWCAAKIGRRLSTPFASLALLLAGCLAALQLQGQVWPWYANSAALGGLLIWIGWRVRPGLQRLAVGLSRQPMLCFALALGLSAATLVFYRLNGQININRGIYGENFWLFLAGAFSGTAALASWGLLMPPLRILRLLSDHTLVIFCTHIYLIHLSRRFPLASFDKAERTALLVLYALLVTIVCLVVARRVSPWVLAHVVRKPPSSHPRAREASGS